MDVALFDYDLPPELIAQFPVRRRDQSRLMVLERDSGNSRHFKFHNIIDFLNKSDGLVVNNTKVFKARLWGQRETGARIEVFLVRKIHQTEEIWEALVSPSKRVNEGEYILFDDKSILLKCYHGMGSWEVSFESAASRKRIIASHGHVPLPHYINRDDQPSDIRRYQTIFAGKDKTGAVAAPTAGFHFTRPILNKLKQKGVKLIELTLHVGPGTFKPIKTDNIEDHTVDLEYAELNPEAADSINKIRARGGKIFAVGTTSVRTLESAKIVGDQIQPFAGMVDLYIKPGFKFKVVDHLVTNFHLPKSSLLVLVSAFAGRERILEAYREAVEHKYRFYSYGDAMLIL